MSFCASMGYSESRIFHIVKVIIYFFRTYLVSNLVFWASQVTQMVKNLPGVQDTWVRSLGWEDPLEKEMASHSSILTWRIPWTEEPGGLQFTVSKN